MENKISNRRKRAYRFSRERIRFQIESGNDNGVWDAGATCAAASRQNHVVFVVISGRGIFFCGVGSELVEWNLARSVKRHAVFLQVRRRICRHFRSHLSSSLLRLHFPLSTVIMLAKKWLIKLAKKKGKEKKMGKKKKEIKEKETKRKKN